MTKDFTISAMRPTDWPAVKAIYLEGIATGSATFETEAPSWEDWSASHLEVGRIIAQNEAGVLGWAALSPVSRRQAYAGVAEVSVYVSAHHRRIGVGRALLEKLIADAEDHGIWTLQAVVFPENEATIALHRACGFREVGRRERIGKLNGIWRDTLLFERRSRTID